MLRGLATVVPSVLVGGCGSSVVAQPAASEGPIRFAITLANQTTEALIFAVTPGPGVQHEDESANARSASGKTFTIAAGGAKQFNFLKASVQDPTVIASIDAHNAANSASASFGISASRTGPEEALKMQIVLAKFSSLVFEISSEIEALSAVTQCAAKNAA